MEMTTDPAASNALGDERATFLVASGNAEVISFDQSLRHREISNWISKSLVTKDQVREAFDQFGTKLLGAGKKGADFEVRSTALTEIRRIRDLKHRLLLLTRCTRNSFISLMNSSVRLTARYTRQGRTTRGSNICRPTSEGVGGACL